MLVNSVILNGQYVKDLSFENPKSPYSLLQKEKPEIDVSVDLNANKLDEKAFEVVMSVVAKSKIKDDIIFLIDLKYAGTFTLEINDEAQLEEKLFVDCPVLLFPYARSIISSLTSDGGFMPLYISPIDFKKLYHENKNNKKAS